MNADRRAPATDVSRQEDLHGHRYRYHAEESQEDRRRIVAAARRQLFPVPEDAQLSLERDRADVQQPARDVRDAVQRTVAGERHHRRAHPRARRDRAGLVHAVRQTDLDQGRDRRSGVEGHGAAAGRRPRERRAHRTRRVQGRRRGRRPADRRPRHAAPRGARENRVDAALVAQEGKRRRRLRACAAAARAGRRTAVRRPAQSAA